MGRRGPAKTPTKIALARGETRPSRVNRNEPDAPMLDPAFDPPSHLDDDAVEVWARLAPSLIARGVLTEWDVDEFAAFCCAVVLHRRAVALVMMDGILVESSRGPGALIKHPAAQVIRDQALLMVQIGGRFGLSPADRASLRMPPKEADQDADDPLD